jgi:hypothetical protein
MLLHSLLRCWFRCKIPNYLWGHSVWKRLRNYMQQFGGNTEGTTECLQK